MHVDGAFVYDGASGGAFDVAFEDELAGAGPEGECAASVLASLDEELIDIEVRPGAKTEGDGDGGPAFLDPLDGGCGLELNREATSQA